ncbi:MAG: hypothetical protein LiPW15_71 [Parcubacteria group bacterium LiPW_15]|nr:MAG: hypothetical protein LiPW15_71 [Parcubacteria group bacterium LiPW_15]
MNILLIKNLAAGAIMASVANTSPVAMLSSAVSDRSSAQVSAQNAPDAMDSWLQKLAHKESEGREHIKILDHNNQYSYGCLQFQMATFRSYIRKYDLLENTEDAELENMIYDCDFQKVLARKMIEDDYSNWRNWYTSVSVRNLGLPPRISAQLAEK